MWKLWSIVVALAVALVACDTPGEAFGEADVLSFAIEGELAPSKIDRRSRRIEVTLEDDSRGAATVARLTLSSKAKSTLEEGDVLDLRASHAFTVTAENGENLEWEVLAQSDDPGGAGGQGGAGGGCPSRLVTYRLTGRFEITDTPLGAGNAVREVGPGELELRITDVEGEASRVELISYQLTQHFVVDSAGVSVRTATETRAARDVCGLARGELERRLLTWGVCDYGPAPPHGTTDWGMSDVVGGPGCLNGYHVEGRIECSGLFCGASGVDFPLVLDEIYPQPLNSFEFSQDLETFSMEGLGAPALNAGRPGVELPSSQPSRTWLSLTGARTSTVCEEPPSCPAAD